MYVYDKSLNESIALEKISKLQKSQLSINGGINIYSIVEFISWGEKAIIDIAKHLGEKLPEVHNQDYNTFHDSDGFEPGYF